MSLRFFADHCVPTSVVDSLRLAGHEVLRLKECLPPDSADPVVIAKAQELQAILISLNGDFSDIVSYPPSEYRGVVSLQVKNHPEVMPVLVERLLKYTETYSEIEHYAGTLFVVEAHRIRIRQ